MRADGQRRGLVLYSRSSELLEKASQALKDGGISSFQDGRLLAVPVVPDEGAALIVLATRLDEFEQQDLKVGGYSAEEMFTAEPLHARLRSFADAWFRDALANDRFSFYFQPIVDTADCRIFAYECLVRLQSDRFYTGAQISEAAARGGNLSQFDAYCRVKAIRSAAHQHRPGTKIFVNFLPSTIQDPEVCMKSTVQAIAECGIQPEDIVFEVVETDEIRSLTHLHRIADYYKSQGFGLALDDVGSGSNSLQMICEFRPDYIKLDKSLTVRLDEPMRLAAIRKLVELADDFGVKVIAEGIETAEGANQASSVGVRLMQGYHFGRPGPSMLHRTDDLLRLMEKLHGEQPLLWQAVRQNVT